MASKNKYEILIDFIIDLTMDSSKAGELAKKVQEQLKDVSPDIDFDEAKIKAAVDKIAGSFEAVEQAIIQIEKEVDKIDFDVADKSLDEFEKQLKGLENIDIDTLDKLLGDMPDEEFKKLKDSLGGLFDDIPDEIPIPDIPPELENDIKKLAAQFEATEKEIKQMLDTEKKALAQMKLDGQEGSEAYNKLEQEIAQAEKELEKLNNASKQTDIAGPAEQSGKSLMERMATFSLAMQGVEQVTGAFSNLSKSFVELDTSTQKIKTLGGAAKQIAPQLRELAISMSKEIPIAATEINNATYDALSAGISADENSIKAFMEASSKLAVAGAVTVGDAVNQLSSLVNAYGESAEKTAQYSDDLFTTVNLGKTSVPELNASLSNIIPTASAAGISFKNIGASLALMTANGVPTAQATTKLNAMLIELQKPGAALSPILEKAGVSLESLKNEGLPENLKRIDVALEEAGITATQAFSSSEAGAAFNVLAKDTEKFQGTLDQFNSSAGTTQLAFEDMNQSIANKVASAKIAMDNFITGTISGLGGLGVGAVVASNSLQEMAPAITAVAGLKTLVPPGTIAGLGNLAKTIVSTLVPSLFTQTVAQEGATAAQMKFNVAALANPYLLIAAGIAGLVTGLYFLSEALNVTAKERREELQAEDESLKQKVKVVQQQKEVVNSNLSLVESFKKQGKSAMENNDLMLKLAKTYPGVISSSKSYEENLKALEQAANKDSKAIKEFDKELQELAKQKIELDFKFKKNAVEVAKQDLLESLDDSLWFWEGSEDKIAKPFADAIYNAKNDKDLEKARNEFKMSIWNNKDIDEKDKQGIIDNIDKMVDAQKEVLESRKGKLNASLQSLVEGGFSEKEIISSMKKEYGLTEAEIQKMIKAQKESKNVTQEQTTKVKDLAEEWNNASKANSEAINKQLATANELYRQMNDKNLSKEERAETKKKYDEEMKLLKMSAKEKKNFDKIQELNQKRAGLINEQGKTALQLAQERTKIENDGLNVQQGRSELEQKIMLLEQNRDASSQENLAMELKKLDVLTKQRENAVKHLKDVNLVTQDSDGNIMFKPGMKEPDKNEIAQWLLDLEKNIVDQQGSVKKLKIDAGINLAEEELQKSLRELEKKQIEFNIEYGLAEKSDLLPLLEKELEITNQKIQKAQIANDDKLAVELKSNAIDIQTEINSVKEDIVQEGLDNIKDKYEKHAEQLSEIQNKQLEQLKEFNEIWYNTIEGLADDKLNKELEGIDNAESEKLKKYEEWKELGIISDKQFEIEKTRIANEAKAEREESERLEAGRKLAREYEQKGLELEVSRKQELDKLTLTKTSLEEQIAIYDAMTSPKTEAQQKEYDKLKAEHEKTLQMMELYGTEFGTLAVGVGEIANQRMIEGIAGDPDAMKNALKKTMGLMAGYLEQKISAFILDMILTPGNVKYLGALPFPLNLAAVPLITTATTALVHKFSNPILSKLTSFAGGGRFDVPTAIVGDAKNAGSPRNSEWVFRDADVMAYATLAASMANANVIGAIERLNNRLSSLNIEFGISLGELRGALRVEDYLAAQGRR